MAQIKINQFKFNDELIKLRYIVDHDETIKFVAKDIAKSLQYLNWDRIVKIQIDNKYKTTIENVKLLNNYDRDHPLYLHKSTMLLDKIGVLQLFLRSKLPNALELQTWFMDSVVDQCHQLEMMEKKNENDDNKEVKEEEEEIIIEKTIAFNATPVYGYFYVATTSEYAERDLYKIGQTTNLHRRLACLNRSRADFDQMFYVLQTEPTTHCTLLKKMVKQELKPYKNNDEIYCATFDHIKRVFESCLQMCSALSCTTTRCFN
ncbi:bro-a [Catopsilia pomona nucleopolyhedrovirus]|uniref:Bro-a n=1 Tax=Catopsilia pomona nucleopolyhedrovirus TaxID=1850906 RepID=A0A172WZG1_9ABAC|nr:bro-a [Catopsilia pomona nucleopolyhedrovirus]ANF29747.1 bro-a [Catopsilia pomona nucleopolyhedrovirus]